MVYRRGYRGSSYRGRGRFRKAGYYGRFKPRRTRGGGIVIEKKFLDKKQTISSVGTAGETWGVTFLDIPLVTGESGRTGRKVVVTNVAMRFTFTWFHENDGITQAINTDDNTVRLLLVIDKQANGVSAGILDVLDQSGDVTNLLHCFNQLANKGRFITLMDKLIVFNSKYMKNTTTDITHETREVKFYKRCRIPIMYNSSNGVISERCCNNITGLVISAYSDLLTPQINLVKMHVDSRMRYMDI